MAKKDELKQRLLDQLAELYFLRNNGQMYEFQAWSIKGRQLANIDDEDIRNDQKFSQLQNLNTYNDEEPLLETKHSLNDSISPPAKKVRKESPVRSQPPATTESLSTTVAPTITTTTEATATTDTAERIEPKREPEPANEETLGDSAGALDSSTRLGGPTSSPSSREELAAQDTVPQISESAVSGSEQVDKQPQRSPAAVASEQPALANEQQVAPSSSSLSASKEPADQTAEAIEIKPSVQSTNVEQTPLAAESDAPPADKSSSLKTVEIEVPANEDSVRAAQEANVSRRIAELRKQGLWSARRLPKLQEPPRPKTHWDYLLEEAKWLHNDYKLEKKWKRDAARKLAHAAYRSVHNKKTQVARIEREKLQYVRKIAASLSKEVRSFWSSIEKIVDFRQQTKLEETRKKAWGLHLNYILDQTSKFSNSCLEEQPQPQPLPLPQTLATNEVGNNYLNNKESEDIEMKNTVIAVSISY